MKGFEFLGHDDHVIIDQATRDHYDSEQIMYSVSEDGRLIGLDLNSFNYFQVHGFTCYEVGFLHYNLDTLAKPHNDIY